MLINYLLLWALFAVAAGSVAKGKNRSVLLWAFLGLLIGPFAALAVALMKTAPGPEQKYH